MRTLKQSLKKGNYETEIKSYLDFYKNPFEDIGAETEMIAMMSTGSDQSPEGLIDRWVEARDTRFLSELERRYRDSDKNERADVTQKFSEIVKIKDGLYKYAGNSLGLKLPPVPRLFLNYFEVMVEYARENDVPAEPIDPYSGCHYVMPESTTPENPDTDHLDEEFYAEGFEPVEDEVIASHNYYPYDDQSSSASDTSSVEEQSASIQPNQFVEAMSTGGIPLSPHYQSIAENTQRMADSLVLSNENTKLLREKMGVAIVKEASKPNVTVNMVNNIYEVSDIDSVLKRLSMGIKSSMNSSGEGVGISMV